MWQSHVENKHCSASVKNELAVPIKAMGLPPHRAQVSALFVAGSSSYTRKSSFTLGHYIEYARSTVNAVKFSKLQCSVSPVLRWLQTQSNTNGERDTLTKTEAPL